MVLSIENLHTEDGAVRAELEAMFKTRVVHTLDKKKLTKKYLTPWTQLVGKKEHLTPLTNRLDRRALSPHKTSLNVTKLQYSM